MHPCEHHMHIRMAMGHKVRCNAPESTLEGSPGNDMLYFVAFAVLKSPEHLWERWTNEYDSG